MKLRTGFKVQEVERLTRGELCRVEYEGAPTLAVFLGPNPNGIGLLFVYFDPPGNGGPTLNTDDEFQFVVSYGSDWCLEVDDEIMIDGGVAVNAVGILRVNEDEVMLKVRLPGDKASTRWVNLKDATLGVSGRKLTVTALSWRIWRQEEDIDKRHTRPLFEMKVAWP